MKIHEWFLVLFVVTLMLCGCAKVEYKYVPTCPYGVSYMTAKDYEVISDPNQVSDLLADWIVANDQFCEESVENVK